MKATDGFLREIINMDGLHRHHRYGLEMVSGGIGARMPCDESVNCQFFVFFSGTPLR